MGEARGEPRHGGTRGGQPTRCARVRESGSDEHQRGGGGWTVGWGQERSRKRGARLLTHPCAGGEAAPSRTDETGAQHIVKTSKKKKQKTKA